MPRVAAVVPVSVAAHIIMGKDKFLFLVATLLRKAEALLLVLTFMVAQVLVVEVIALLLKCISRAVTSMPQVAVKQLASAADKVRKEKDITAKG